LGNDESARFGEVTAMTAATSKIACPVRDDRMRTSDRFMVVLQELIDHTLRCGCPHDVALHRLEDQADSVRFPVTRSRDSTPIEISQVPLEAILGMRDLYRQEMNCQIVHDSLHARHFTDSYLICVSGARS
jgi:hypothetical protein